jgi:hypothetical protein
VRELLVAENVTRVFEIVVEQTVRNLTVLCVLCTQYILSVNNLPKAGQGRHDTMITVRAMRCL